MKSLVAIGLVGLAVYLVARCWKVLFVVALILLIKT